MNAKTNTPQDLDPSFTEERRRKTATEISQTLILAGYEITADQVLSMAGSASARKQFRSLMRQFTAMGQAGWPLVIALLQVNVAFDGLIREAEARRSAERGRRVQFAAQLVHAFSRTGRPRKR